MSQFTAAMHLPKHKLIVSHLSKKNKKRASKPLRAECSFTGSPCWTRTNDPSGQKHSRPARLERFARLLVSSCSSIAYSRRRRRQRLSQFTAAMRLPKHKLAGLHATRDVKKKNPTLRVELFFFGSPCWTRTNDPAVNSRMLYRLS